MKSRRIVSLIDRRIERLKAELEDLEKARALLAGEDEAPARPARTKAARSAPRRSRVPAPAREPEPVEDDEEEQDDERVEEDEPSETETDDAPAARPDGPFAAFRRIMADGGEHTAPDLIARAAEMKVRAVPASAHTFLSQGIERGDFERVAHGRYRARKA